jgi:hypothetical protein
MQAAPVKRWISLLRPEHSSNSSPSCATKSVTSTKAVDKYGRVYVNFSPAVSRPACKAMRQTIRGWRLQLKCDKELADLATMFDPILTGWQQYFGRFYGSAMSDARRRALSQQRRR